MSDSQANTETGLVAVVGGGAAGLTAAHLISQRRDVVLFESAPRLGGHAWTHVVERGADQGLALDLGFMVMNDRNYPTMLRLLARLGVDALAPSDMSFGYWNDARRFGYAISWSPENPYARQLNIGSEIDPRFLTLLNQVVRFQRRAARDLAAGHVEGLTLGAYLDRLQASSVLRDDYLLPFSSAIWSTAPEGMLDYPLAQFLNFFTNHGMLSFDAPPQWKHIAGGSVRYVGALQAKSPRLRVVHSAVDKISRTDTHVDLFDRSGHRHTVQQVIIATHADEALALLAAPSDLEVRCLGAWRYQSNHALLHTDQSVMPPERRHWASWNCRKPSDAASPVLTYHLNRLQGHDTAQEQYFLSLNPDRAHLPAVDPERRLLEVCFQHPTYSTAAVTTRRDLVSAQGNNRTFYCGSYFGHGFHEDAIASGAQVAEFFGVSL